MDNPLLEKLETFYIRFKEIGQLITDPEVIQDMERYVRLTKEYKDLEAITVAADKYKQALGTLEESREILESEEDKELKEMAEMEIGELTEKLPQMEQDIKMLLVPADPEDSKNVILEIRGGTGGDEACLFAGDLFRMYSKFCERRGWKMEVTNANEGTAGGYKEIVVNVSGNGVYGILKYESGVHRVQRVPSTETQGRIHTSAATVAVLPEAEEVDVQLNPADIRKDTYCSSGPGGQSVNTTYSAIRLTHIPTGIVVTCQDEKSQIKNLAKAMKELRSRIYAIEYQKYMDDIASKRKTMVSTGDRSAKIRTYNFPQGRVTDHRINFTLYNLAAVMDGEIDEIIEKLQIEENTERLKESGL
ncbi:MAG: peptide chain release factor 1 [Odoribacter splanchnicus]|nr:peptide chain release factor 1 [Odoribacter splanchnicus]